MDQQSEPSVSHVLARSSRQLSRILACTSVHTDAACHFRRGHFQVLRLAVARYVGLKGEAFIAQLRSTKDGRDSLPGSVNMVNVLSASIATTFAFLEYRYKKWWMTNVLAAALATTEIIQDSQYTVAWTMAKLGCVAGLQLIRRLMDVQWVDAVSVSSRIFGLVLHRLAFLG